MPRSDLSRARASGDVTPFLAEGALRFVGFTIDAATVRLFAARCPELDALTDLDRWQAFELLEPQTFAGMYRFTVQKPPHAANDATVKP